MKYSVEIERNIFALAYCIQRVQNGIDNICDWRVSVNAGGIDYGIYFNFDIENKKLEICNQPQYDESLYLDEIIKEINGEEDEDYD